ncbi:class I SAM-dependent methyltransferase [Paenibacillus harenae]|uniref:class I SAM-dependent methyltransferase n=1 Tax=Paenibacillus harenae TaxID=306543 RepID=UPI00040426E3|nr:class I SAM-dependent methyltransferase [Paenibacillus harenae]
MPTGNSLSEVELIFPDITEHPQWLRSQSKSWCDQLAAQTGQYALKWSYTTEGMAAEHIFTEQLSGLIRGRVLDVGCGHGEFTNLWSDRAEEVVGYDMTEGFLATATRNRKPNVRFVLGRTHDGLPFEDSSFDVAYTKKGPTSWYPEASRILRPGADVLSLHPGDGNGEGGELGLIFPGLFSPPAAGTPILDIINTRLNGSGLTVLEIRNLRETVYIPSAEDIIAMIGFGQNEHILRWVEENYGNSIRSQFERHRGEKGIRTTNFYYLLHAKAAGSM